MTVSEHHLKEYMEGQFDDIRTQQNENHSDNLAQLKEMNIRLSKMEKTIGEWKFGGKLAFWIFVAVGGVVTWFLNVFGIHVGFRP